MHVAGLDLSQARFVTISRFGQLTPEQARSLAQETLASVRHGHDPADERRKEGRRYW